MDFSNSLVRPMALQQMRSNAFVKIIGAVREGQGFVAEEIRPWTGRRKNQLRMLDCMRSGKTQRECINVMPDRGHDGK